MGHLRTLQIVSDGEVVDVSVPSTRQVSAVGRYWCAVYDALDHNDGESLIGFEDVQIAGRYLEADLDVVETAIAGKANSQIAALD